MGQTVKFDIQACQQGVLAARWRAAVWWLLANWGTKYELDIFTHYLKHHFSFIVLLNRIAGPKFDLQF